MTKPRARWQKNKKTPVSLDNLLSGCYDKISAGKVDFTALRSAYEAEKITEIRCLIAKTAHERLIRESRTYKAYQREQHSIEKAYVGKFVSYFGNEWPAHVEDKRHKELEVKMQAMAGRVCRDIVNCL